jgi:hypothetical protein
METSAEPTTPQPAEVAAPSAATAPAEIPELVTEQLLLFSTAVAAQRPATAKCLAGAIRGVATAVLGFLRCPKRSRARLPSRRSREGTTIP